VTFTGKERDTETGLEFFRGQVHVIGAGTLHKSEQSDDPFLIALGTQGQPACFQSFNSVIFLFRLRIGTDARASVARQQISKESHGALSDCR